MEERHVPEVVLFIVDAGGGHRSAANALVAAAEETRRPWRFRTVSLQSVLAPVDVSRWILGVPMEDAYNALVRRRWTGFLVPMLRILHGLTALLDGPLTSLLAKDLAGRRPVSVVSLAPNFNRALRDAVRRSHPGIPFVTLLTDYVDFPPHFWIEPGVDRVIVGSDRAVEQALEAGIHRERISRISGMLLHPRFYSLDRREARLRLRRQWGVGPEGFVVLLLFGAKGSPEMASLSERLLKDGARGHVVAICGDNPGLFDALAAAEASSGGRLHRVGFTDRVADYMAACDVLVTKPGPGSLAEAFHTGVPVVVTCDRYTVPQERVNARFVAQEGLGLVARGWRGVPQVVSELARDPALRARIQRKIAELPENRAVYEALEIIRKACGDGKGSM